MDTAPQNTPFRSSSALEKRLHQLFKDTINFFSLLWFLLATLIGAMVFTFCREGYSSSVLESIYLGLFIMSIMLVFTYFSGRLFRKILRTGLGTAIAEGRFSEIERTPMRSPEDDEDPTALRTPRSHGNNTNKNNDGWKTNAGPICKALNDIALKQRYTEGDFRISRSQFSTMVITYCAAENVKPFQTAITYAWKSVSDDFKFIDGTRATDKKA